MFQLRFVYAHEIALSTFLFKLFQDDVKDCHSTLARPRNFLEQKQAVLCCLRTKVERREEVHIEDGC